MNTTAALERARTVRAERRAVAPTCTAKVTKKGKVVTCGARMAQNGVEVERGVYWCPECSRYTDGSHGFPVKSPRKP